jgi:hypothetical protein
VRGPRTADELLDRTGQWGGEAAPPPMNVAQARLLVGNLLAWVQQRIQARTQAEAADDGSRSSPQDRLV